MITHAQAFDAGEFHLRLSGDLPCAVWHRAGPTHVMYADNTMPAWLADDCGGFFLPVYRNADPENLRRDSETEWHHITGANAADFHVAGECPLGPAVSGRPEDPPVLDAGYRDESGRDAFGYDRDGYDRDGYDRDGYDAKGYGRDGYDRDGKDEDGCTRQQTRHADELDLAGEWQDFPSYNKDEFREHLRSVVRDPDEIDDLEWCGNCDEPTWDSDLHRAGTGQDICESCWDDWFTCDSCDERYPGDDLYTTLDESTVCDRCRDRYYSWCEDCDGYYNDNYADEHDHDSAGSGCCDSPQMRFSIRNDGNAPLANDTRVTVALPAGVISDEGLTAIRRYLQQQGHWDLGYNLEPLGAQWQTREGNFTKRLSRHAYKNHQAKLTPEVLSQVGCIARDHSSAAEVTIEVSRDLNASAEDWYHEDSCWWGSYYESRCALKTNGGFGLRSFDGYRVTGRAWVMPLRQREDGRLVPTFDTMTPDAFVVFNGYGDLSGYSAPRILAHMAGWTYRKTGFDAHPMYINAGGYLIAPEHIAGKYTDGHLSLDISQHSRLFETETERELCHA